MLRRADHKDVAPIQAVLNNPQNWDKLESYSDEAVLSAINDEQMTVLVWEEDGQWRSFFGYVGLLKGQRLKNSL